MATYDVAVIGAGVEGSAAAYFLLKSGVKNVLLLEQFSAMHSRGSSHGLSRITRRAYNKPYYVEMMNDAYCLWSDLEKESGTEIYRRTGIMVFAPGANRVVPSIADSLAQNKVPHEVFSGREAKRRYPHQLKIPDEYTCVFEDGGGILQSQNAVAAFQQQFQRLGGRLLDNHQVVQIIPGGSGDSSVATVVTSRGRYRAKHLVMAAGAWTTQLCSSIGLHLPFTVKRTEAHYWRVEDPAMFTPDQFPVFIGCFSDDEKDLDMRMYGIPILEYPGLLKVCSHGGVELGDPDSRDRCGGPVTATTVSGLISGSLRGVATRPNITEYCMYTMSPDNNPVIDRHPLHKNIIIAAGFSGHGFKLSPVVGKLIAELVTGQKPSHDLTPFRVTRFLTPKSPL